LPTLNRWGPALDLQMNLTADTCDLCGLCLSGKDQSLVSNRRTYYFCCLGCQQVFTMLMEASGSADPDAFRQSELFKKCRRMGIIPGSAAEARQRRQPSSNGNPDIYHGPGPNGGADENRNRQHATLNLSFRVGGMWCPACAWLIEETLKRTGGVIRAACSFSTDRVRCEYNPVQISPDQLADTIGKLGYRAVSDGEKASNEKNKEFVRFAVCAFLTANVMMLSFALYTGYFTALSPDAVYKLSWPIFIMAGIVVLYGGQNIYRKALIGLSSATFGMETLIAAGSFSAYFYSAVNLFSGSIHLYFDTAAMLVTLVLLGKALESRAKEKVRADLDSFFSLQPAKVKICTGTFPEGRYVDSKQLKRGDIFQVTTGETVPADGQIMAGSGAMDESSLTGEAVPVRVKPFDRVRSGTAVIRGTLRVKAETVGKDSTLGQMIGIMEIALSEKTPLEGRTDRILQWFVPLILSLALGTGLIARIAGLPGQAAMIRAVTVMVISCPCALGIAIPLARVAGISIAGKQGILVRSFSCFEQVPHLTAIVFDKTGTITQGRWNLLSIYTAPPCTEEGLLALAAALEKNSEHDIAMEIKRQAEVRRLEPVALKGVEMFENGIRGYLDDRTVKIGSRDFVGAGLSPVDQFYPAHTRPDAAANSAVYMSLNGKICGAFVFGDRVKSGAADVIRRLQAARYRTCLISGDGQETTDAVAQMTGFKQSYGNQLPSDKAFFVKELQRSGQKVAMVGDGINDAPALLQADLSMAIHSGSHLGKEVADISLMRGNPAQVPAFLDLAERVNKKIFQNLAVAFVYNLTGIPLAMAGFLNPLIAVSAMLLSSLSVVGNTLLLTGKINGD